MDKIKKLKLFFLKQSKYLLFDLNFYWIFAIFFFIFRIVFFPLYWVFSKIKLVFNDCREVYIDVYWFNFVRLLRDLLLAFWHTNLGDFLERLITAAAINRIRRFQEPNKTFEYYDKVYYWQGNPAFFMMDKFWKDVVDYYDDNVMRRYNNFKKAAVVAVEEFADHPYKQTWAGLRALSKVIFKKRKMFRIPNPFRPIFSFFKSLFYRWWVVLRVFNMRNYYGLGKRAITEGNVPALKLSFLDFDFETGKIVRKEYFDKEQFKNASIDEIMEAQLKDEFIQSRALIYNQFPFKLAKDPERFKKFHKLSNYLISIDTLNKIDEKKI